MRSFISIATGVTLSLALVMNPFIAGAQTVTPTTPIQHVVIIYGENVSFDHYFATYPVAANPPGQPRFTALPGTPAVNGLCSPAKPACLGANPLLTNNPNLTNTINGSSAANPFRFNRSQAYTADMNHSYTPEQNAFDLGALDLFPFYTGSSGNTTILYPPAVATKGQVMGYFDGNTVTAMWNYAQHFAMNDNNYNTQFGPSTPGAINVTSGQTNGIVDCVGCPSSSEVLNADGSMTLIGDADPLTDVCSTSGFQVSLGGQNIGNLLTNANISWGWFQGGFDLTVTNPNGTMGCSRSTVSPITGLTEADYVQHHNPFQFYASTRNSAHTRPTGVATIGMNGDNGNHIYDTHDFFDALAAGNLPAVSYLKAQSYQNAHPGNSNPLDEQAFVVNVINTLQQSPFWNSTAVIIDYDDSDGWYDHQMGPIVNGSFSTADTVSGTNACGMAGVTPQLPGISGSAVNGRCGYGPRTPFLIISPWANPNFVDHTLINQASVVRFIEDNWNLGRLGGGSADAGSGPINPMFNFTQSTPQNTTPLILSTITGQPE
jgi:phospholipase C